MSEWARTGENDTTAFERVETSVQRKFDIAHSYHVDAQAFPNDREKAWAAEGRILLINWKPSSAANGWSIAAGGAIDDSVIRPAADRLRDFGQPLFLALYHEPENNLPGGSDTEAGTAEDYVAMWRHVRSIFDERGATNVVWVWNMMGWKGHASHYLSGDLYPGDAYVDWIAYDPYNQGTGGSSWSSFEAITDNPQTSGPAWPGFYSWATSAHPDKPLMLAEYGTPEDPGDSNRKAQWFADELEALRTTRKAIRAAVYWDGYNYDVHIDTSAAALESFRSVGKDPLLNPPRP